MSELHSEPAVAGSPQRKPSTNKNIKKLRTISMVCSLTRSWQQWVSEIEDKQASEPTGWAPDVLRGLGEEPKKLDGSKTGPSEKKARASQNPTADAPIPEHQEDSASTKRANPEVSAESRIKTKQVSKTVTSSAQEKSTGIALLTERICKEPQPPEEDIDSLLSKRSSPTRRRKCSNMVSALTSSWKEVEKERKQGHSHSVDTEDSGYSEERSTEAEGGLLDGARAFGESECGDSGSPEGHTESSVKIKRSSVPAVKKEAEDSHNINALSKKYSAVGSLKSRWQNWASDHSETQKLNPFSEEFDYEYSMSTRLRKGEEGYGRPKEGTKTAERAKRAEQHIHGEIDDMCYIIRTMADPDPDGKTRVTFGQLFDRYVRISDKVVGILMRARKHGKLVFEGEMLWQGQDDAVVITLLV
ncbi:actin binding Rho activating protein b [Hypomesus transpacificus]|uniref:actin binding Rho activating protein b n=1 Tax=Hypomesus transpacificus TaxID=137520 RepID=UPI001F07B925|nr:actin binding Rho activating protein b [Hypomesus transpacificus]